MRMKISEYNHRRKNALNVVKHKGSRSKAPKEKPMTHEDMARMAVFLKHEKGEQG